MVEPLLPVGQSGPYPEHLREHFEGVIWRFRTGSPWRDMPAEHGVWQTVYHSFVKWRDEGVFQSLMDAVIAEAARRGQADLSLVSVDSTTARAHHDAAGMVVRAEVLEALEEATMDEKGARERRESGKSPQSRSHRRTTPTPSARNVGGSADGAARG